MGVDLALLQRSILFALEKHKGQARKWVGGPDDGQPYIVHPLRVMCSAETLEEAVVAVLHDVLEDTSASVTDLHDLGLPAELVAAVTSLTRYDSESYYNFIERVASDPLARRVKMLDITDNLETLPADHDLERRYVWAYKHLVQRELEAKGGIR